jgi:UDP-N-acetylglucosamine--N-acetylmuramyl-(pentapeptide) pyrophosphoryl-undecaprenol N-acetylglucosamine transferase
MSKKLLVMAGGTGGHVFPAIAVAQTLQKKGWEICWLGTKDRMEAQLVPKHGIPIRFIQISGLRGKGIKALLGAPFAILRAVLQARKIIQEYQPNAGMVRKLLVSPLQLIHILLKHQNDKSPHPPTRKLLPYHQ